MSGSCAASGTAPLTFQQEARFIRAAQARSAGGRPRSNLVTDPVVVRGPLDRERLAAAAQAVATLQPALRARFVGGRQEIVSCRDRFRPWVPVVDETRTATEELADKVPMRARLLVSEHSPDRHLVELVADHMVVDGRSIDLFWRALWRAYDEPPDLSSCRCEPGYPTLLRQQRRPATGDRWRCYRALLEERDSPYGFTDLPIKLALDVIGPRTVAELPMPLAQGFAGRLIATARRCRTTPFTVCVAAVTAALRTVTSARRPMFYTYLENRPSAMSRRSIGWYAATVLLVGDDTGSSAEEAELASARSVVSDAMVRGVAGTEWLHRVCGAGARSATLPSVSLAINPDPRSYATAELTVQQVTTEQPATPSLPRGRISVDLLSDAVVLSYEPARYDEAVVQQVADQVQERLVRLTGAGGPLTAGA